MAELIKLKDILLKTKDGLLQTYIWTKDVLLKTEDILLKTKDSLLKTEDNRKQNVNICLWCTQEQEQKSDQYSTTVLKIK